MPTKFLENFEPEKAIMIGVNICYF